MVGNVCLDRKRACLVQVALPVKVELVTDSSAALWHFLVFLI